MTTSASIVFFDTETAGLRPEHPTIQLAAIAVDTGDDWRELESFERKIAFDWRQADPEALRLNHWTAEAWADAQPEAVVVRDFAAFIDRHRSVELVSRRTGRPYRVARVGGHNIAGFDLERVSAMFKRHGVFFAADFRSPLDSRYGAVWFFESPSGTRTPGRLEADDTRRLLRHSGRGRARGALRRPAVDRYHAPDGLAMATEQGRVNRPGALREQEWMCLCPDNSAIRSGSLSRCHRCGACRPDTAAIAKVVEETRRVMSAIETFDRMESKVGRYQAMQEVLRVFCGGGGRL